jgi:hypothetical protein
LLAFISQCKTRGVTRLLICGTLAVSAAFDRVIRTSDSALRQGSLAMLLLFAISVLAAAALTLAAIWMQPTDRKIHF